LSPAGHAPIFDANIEDTWDHCNNDVGVCWNVDNPAPVVHNGHMTTTIIDNRNIIYVVTIRDGDGLQGVLAVRTVQQDAIDIATVYNRDRYGRWADVTAFDTTSVNLGLPVELPGR
jgi:hypothetical protein